MKNIRPTKKIYKNQIEFSYNGPLYFFLANWRLATLRGFLPLNSFGTFFKSSWSPPTGLDGIKFTLFAREPSNELYEGNFS